MRIHWGLTMAVGATIALGNVALAVGPKIDRVQIEGERDGAQVSIEGAFGEPRYAVRAREGGRLIVIDVDQAALPSGGIETSGSNALVARTVASTTARGARIELSLTGEATYHARARDGRITVSLRRGSGPSDHKGRPAESANAKIESIQLE
ncbi:MAG: hypothetical protein WBG86_01070, partial [Polyangiales bacterium]